MQNETLPGQRIPLRTRPNHTSNGKSSGHGGPDQSSVSIIGADITITGDIHALEDLVIEGKVEGGVTCGTLVLGESGRVHGNIRTERLQVSGEVHGSISTSDLAIEANAKIHGDIEYSRLRVAGGAVIQGQLSKREGENSQDIQGSAEISRIRPTTVFEDPSYRDAAKSGTD